MIPDAEDDGAVDRCAGTHQSTRRRQRAALVTNGIRHGRGRMGTLEQAERGKECDEEDGDLFHGGSKS